MELRDERGWHKPESEDFISSIEYSIFQKLAQMPDLLPAA